MDVCRKKGQEMLDNFIIQQNVNKPVGNSVTTQNLKASAESAAFWVRWFHTSAVNGKKELERMTV